MRFLLCLFACLLLSMGRKTNQPFLEGLPCCADFTGTWPIGGSHPSPFLIPGSQPSEGPEVPFTSLVFPNIKCFLPLVSCLQVGAGVGHTETELEQVTKDRRNIT